MSTSPAYSFGTNSHTPSDPSAMSQSVLPSISISLMSGIGLTPAIAPHESPSDRDMARPGILSFLSHTLGGPFERPNASLKGSTRPLHFVIRSCSSFNVGL